MKVNVGKITIPNFPADIPRKLAEAARSLVLFRIQDGRRIDGSPLLDGRVDTYSERYARWKAGEVKPRIRRRSRRKTQLPPKAGRLLYSPGDRFVFSGAMLRAWRILRVTNLRSLVGFTSTREALKAIGNHERRPTFGLSDDESQELLAEVLSEYGLKHERV